MNIMMLLEMANSVFADRIAFTNSDDNSSFTYQELFDCSGKAALAAQESSNSNFAILDVNSLAMPVGLFGSAWAGLPFVPLNYRLTESEIEAMLARISPTYLVTDENRAATLAARSDISLVTRNQFLNEVIPIPGQWIRKMLLSCCSPVEPRVNRRQPF
jgi:acyl-CoA synthetase (AMP-forming)/AMP-acid ligase II